METQDNPNAEGGGFPPASPTGELTEETAPATVPPPDALMDELAVAPEAEGAATAAPPSRNVLLFSGVAAAVLLFALAFFMGGFAAHALLDDDDNGGKSGTAASLAGADDPSWGPDGAKVTIEAFSDFQCPYCKKFAEDTLPRLKEEYGDRVRYVARDLPLASIHPVAVSAAEAAGCANDQGVYWDYHDLLYQNQETLSAASLVEYAVDAGADESRFSDCLGSRENMAEVLLDVQDAQRQGVSSTPSFLINGLLVSGAQPYEFFQAIIDQTLAAE